MKTMLLLLLLLTVSRAMAQRALKASFTANDISESYPRKVIFSYRNGFGTSHDTVMYLRDTLMGKRTFSLVKLHSGEIRRVPVHSLDFFAAPNPSMLNATLAKAQ